VILRKLAIATLISSALTAGALAQSSPAPANQSGPDVSPTTPSPTDPAAGNETGNTRGVPERGTMGRTPGTTGSAVTTHPRMERDTTSVPGQSIDKDDSVPKSR